MCRYGINIFEENAQNVLGAMMFGVSKKDLLSGAHRYPSHVTFYDWAPFPGFTLVPSITQAIALFPCMPIFD